jgi:hypothetical protein
MSVAARRLADGVIDACLVLWWKIRRWWQQPGSGNIYYSSHSAIELRRQNGRTGHRR